VKANSSKWCRGVASTDALGEGAGGVGSWGVLLASLLLFGCGPSVVAEREDPGCGPIVTSELQDTGCCTIDCPGSGGSEQPWSDYQDEPSYGPTPTSEACDFRRGCDARIVGNLEGAALNHSFATLEETSGVGATLVGDGYFRVQLLGTAKHARQISAGFFRLPSFTGAGKGEWYCVDHGRASLTDGFMALTFDAISRLAPRANAEPGQDWLKGAASSPNGDETTTVPLDGRLGNLPPLYAVLRNYSYGLPQETVAHFTLSEQATSLDRERLVDFVTFGTGKFAQTYTDLSLVFEEEGRFGVAFPSPASSVTTSGPSQIMMDLQQISATTWCGGEPVEGELQLQFRVR
jgi:hypothetical protein